MSAAGTVLVKPEHVLVLLERGAVSFCHYESPYYHSNAAPQWMSAALLQSIIRRAEKSGVALTFLLGKNPPPAELSRLTDATDHAKIVPLALNDLYPGAMLVVSSEESESFAQLSSYAGRNVILRLARRDLGHCSELFSLLTGKFGRLSIQLLDVEHFTQNDLAVYAEELEKLAAAAKKLYAAGARIEINVLSDRMMLKAMRNCDAGEKHITVAPDGKCYICPAFFCDGEAAIGAFDAKKGFVANAPAGVAFAGAPLCTRCDAWHCKRCVHLSHELTLEYNVPSEQQCLIAHAEREASRLALKAFGNIEPFRRLPRIVELNYRDPLELVEMQMPELEIPAAADDPML